MATKRAFAIGCHPDDIEFGMMGTLLQLQKVGYEIHYMNIANGSLGTNNMDTETCKATRRGEAMAATAAVGAIFHESICDDLEVRYTAELFGKLVPVVREVAPEIILTHGPFDYMEDHVNAGRLAVTAAFCRGMTNAKTFPPSADKAYDAPVAVYHSMPHSITDALRRPVVAGLYVDVEEMIPKKKVMLGCHRSQKEWLDISQGMDAYLEDMEYRALYWGRRSKKFKFAEGWLRHNPIGFCAPDFNPLKDVLGDLCLINQEFEDSIKED